MKPGHIFGLINIRFFGLILLATLVLVGCSSTKLAYRYADWGIVWWVDDYIPMTDQQETLLTRDVLALQDWHCSTQLPAYSEWLAELKQDVRSNNLERYRVNYHQEQLVSFFQPLVERAKPPVTRLLSSLSDDQVRALADNMTENQAELEEEFLANSPEQAKQARAERTGERIERWLGPLNSTQTDIVRQWSDARGQQTEIWLEGRRTWQKALLNTLSQRNEENFAEQVGYLIDNNEAVRGPRYQQMMAESRPAMAELMTDLLNNAKKQQLDHLLDRAAELRGDFDALACTGQDTGAPANS